MEKHAKFRITYASQLVHIHLDVMLLIFISLEKRNRNRPQYFLASCLAGLFNK